MAKMPDWRGGAGRNEWSFRRKIATTRAARMGQRRDDVSDGYVGSG